VRTIGVWGVLAFCSVVSAEPLRALRGELLSGDEVKAQEAAQKLGASSDGKAIDVLLEGISLGASPRLLASMLSAIGGKRDARVVPVLAHYAKNRNRELRIKALAALGTQADKRVVPALIAALSDSSADVRAEAALALGKRKERTAEASLLKLFIHKDPSAAGALAAIATPDLAHRLSELLGQVPDPQLCTTLGEILKRPDFGPDSTRSEIVKTLAQIPGIDSTTALIEYVAATEKDKGRPSRLEAQGVVDQRSSQ
jgi:HEAT repeat protein